MLPADYLQKNPPDENTIVKRVPDFSATELEQVMGWIKARTTVEKVPFCWKQSYGRGVGLIPGRLPAVMKGSLTTAPRAIALRTPSGHLRISQLASQVCHDIIGLYNYTVS